MFVDTFWIYLKSENADIVSKPSHISLFFTSLFMLEAGFSH